MSILPAHRFLMVAPRLGWLTLLTLGCGGWLLAGCSTSSTTVPVGPGAGNPGLVIPDSCPAAQVLGNSSRAAIGLATMVLTYPLGSESSAGTVMGASVDCSAVAPMSSQRPTRAATGTLPDGTPYVDYQATFNLPSFLATTNTDWVFQPPPIVTRDGVVTRPVYNGKSLTSYAGTMNPKTVAVQQVSLQAAADTTSPLLNAVTTSVTAAQAGQALSIGFQLSDGESGLPIAPANTAFPLPVAVLGLSDGTNLFPVWYPTLGTETSLAAVVPGFVPAGNYSVYAAAHDNAGNAVVYVPGAAPTVGTTQYYNSLPRPACIPVGVVLPTVMTSLSLSFVNLSAGGDTVPPTLLSLQASAAQVGPCQTIALRMNISDNGVLPTSQQAALWVGPKLDPGKGLDAQLAVLRQVPAFPAAGSAGQLVATIEMAADATPGPWMFLPAYAVDAANNPLIGAYQQLTAGALPQLVLLDPLTRTAQAARIAPGEFAVTGAPAPGDSPDAAVAAPKDAGARDAGVADAGTPSVSTASVPAHLEQVTYAPSGGAYVVTFRYSHPDQTALP